MKITLFATKKKKRAKDIEKETESLEKERREW